MKKWSLDIICGLLALLFVYAAFSKLFDYATFRSGFSRSPFIKGYANVIAWLIPAIELIITMLLVFIKTRMSGLLASLSLLVIFSFYIIAMLLWGENLPCSCGGVISSLSWKQHLIFNLFFITISVLGIVLWRIQKKLRIPKNISIEKKGVS